MNDTSHNDTSMLPAEEPNFLGLALSTHRVLVEHAAAAASDETTSSSNSAFPYEAAIAAIAIAFFRSTVRWQTNEPAVLRYFFCLLLAALALMQKSYELLAAVELFSYVVPWLIVRPALPQQPVVLVRLVSIAVGAMGSLLLAHGVFGSGGAGGGVLLRLVQRLTPGIVVQTLEYLFPVSEMIAAYDIMHQLAMEPDVFKQMIQHLLFVTFHIQVGMGFLGIAFLREEQSRRNMLIRLDVDEGGGGSSSSSSNTDNNGSANRNGDQKKKDMASRAGTFQRSAAPFIFKVALPYMLQIILYGNINKFAFSCVHDEMHRTIRFRQVFEHDNHLTAMATDSPTSPEGTCRLAGVDCFYCLVYFVASHLPILTLLQPTQRQ